MRAYAAAWVCCAWLLSGCAASEGGGVFGAGVAWRASPGVVVTANDPLTVQGSGRQWVSLPSDYLGHQPSGVMDYAVYGEGAEGAIKRHAHAFVVRVSNDRRWYFEPESYPVPGGVDIGRTVRGGYGWVTQIVRVDGENDWFSAMWRESGRETPEFWIARRFSATPERSARIVAEYREPWPECLDPFVKSLVYVRKSCLEGFLARADAAFAFGAFPETGAAEPPEGAPVLRKPKGEPNMERLAGKVREDDTLWLRWR